MSKIIGYAKLGRSMPLTLNKCRNLGGDVEMVAVVKEMALRHPEDTFVLVGRNTGEKPSDVGLPPNVQNPWTEWAPQLRRDLNLHGLNHGNLSVADHLKCQEIYDHHTRDTFDQFDAMVMWIGQHGTSNTPLPRVDDHTTLTKPQDTFAFYCSYLLRGINRWRDVDPWNREEVNLNADPRNAHKMRDLKWPFRHPVLGQFMSSKWIKHARYGDRRGVEEWYAPSEVELVNDVVLDTWRSKIHTTYARLEINGLLPGTPFGDLISFNTDWDRPGNFGLFMNEARSIGIRPELARLLILKQWVMPVNPYFIHGTWTAPECKNVIKPAPWDQYYPRLHSVRCTFTTPSSGSGWATTKPWEAFAAGTVCFFHPAYDTQDNILSDAPAALRKWLRVSSPRELDFRIRHLATIAGRADWEWIVRAQHHHFTQAMNELTYMRLIEERIYG